MPPAQPLVSIIMAFHGGARHLPDAIASVLAQSHAALELLLCDDASTDESPAIARDAAARDGRVRVLHMQASGGPGAARNLGLEAARGDWIGVVDADDLVHPGRIAGMLNAARRLDADVVADDLVFFGGESGRTLLGPLRLSAPWRPDARALLSAETGRPAVPVGYLKPLFRREALGGLRYRTDMPIGEDLNLLMRVALRGVRIAVLPRPWYLYRRHGASTSHRLGPDAIAGMERGLEALLAEMPGAEAALGPALGTWRRRLDHASAFAALVTEIKAGRPLGAARRLLARPPLALPLARAAREGMARRIARPPARSGPHRLVLATAADIAASTPREAVFEVPSSPEGWDAPRAARLAALTGEGDVRLTAIGRPALTALGYVPGWLSADLCPPPDGWSAPESALIAALPWPVVRSG
ncbi:glycosyltransferase [Roseibacterium sp. SDUM158016]|uniref:glycosyltransferase family 2 protein n=1 Tax=Roseicyclus sediminis TaxID=2980997 RepID=UPI0021D37230|nr:glycosyltransferase family 2 protein [Roseibacterium sp. SDUM158016]MCU4654387.1 glycosyltransferase [Roseibacterium sp. SDUM158016]